MAAPRPQEEAEGALHTLITEGSPSLHATCEWEPSASSSSSIKGLDVASMRQKAPSKEQNPHDHIKMVIPYLQELPGKLQAQPPLQTAQPWT